MRAAARLACLLAVASSGCDADEGAVPSSAPVQTMPALVSRAPSPREAKPEPRPVAADPLLREGIAADLTQSHEPMVVVAGWQDDQGTAAVPVYAQRNGGWRRVTSGEWPAGSGSAVREVDAADLDGDGVLEVVALGRAGEGDRTRAALLVYRMRDADLLMVAESLWTGAAHRMVIAEPVGGKRALLVLGGGERVVRTFALEGDHLVATGSSREHPPDRPRRDAIAMTLPGGDRPMRVSVRPATGGPSMVGIIQDWNAELARLRIP